MKPNIYVIILTIIMIFGCAVGFCAIEEDAQQGGVAPKKITADTNYDGKVDRIEHYNENGDIIKTERDSNGDGTMDETVTYNKRKPVKSERDTNGDGKADVWIEF